MITKEPTVNRGKRKGRSGKKGKKRTVDKDAAERDHRGAQHTGYTLKSEASLTGFAVSPRIARTLQRCENFTWARVFPTSISTYLSPVLGVLFSPLLIRGLIPRLIAHAEQTIFFFYYFTRVPIVCFVSIKFPALAVDQKIRRNWTVRIRIELNPPEFNNRKNLVLSQNRSAWIEELFNYVIIHLEWLRFSYHSNITHMVFFLSSNASTSQLYRNFHHFFW